MITVNSQLRGKERSRGFLGSILVYIYVDISGNRIQLVAGVRVEGGPQLGSSKPKSLRRKER